MRSLRQRRPHDPARKAGEEKHSDESNHEQPHTASMARGRVMRRRLAILAAVLAPLAFTAVTAVPAAHATTWQATCDSEAPASQLCLHFNGSQGESVTGRALCGNNCASEYVVTPVAGPGPCDSNGHVVDGGDADDAPACTSSDWWPYTNHGLDQSQGSNTVVRVENIGNGSSYPCAVFYQPPNNSAGFAIQESCSYPGNLYTLNSVGQLWNVVASDSTGSLWDLCSNGAGGHVLIVDQCTGPASKWQTVT